METTVDLIVDGRVAWSLPIRGFIGALEMPSAASQLAQWRKMALGDGVSANDLERGEFKVPEG
jgi:hypothetical protein